MAVNVLSLCHVRETSPGTHTFFPTYTCPVYCWRSVQLLDFGLYCNLIHASQPIRTTFTGQWFASSFLQTPPHDDALAFGCTLPTAGRVRDFHPLERVPAGHTIRKNSSTIERGVLIRFYSVLSAVTGSFLAAFLAGIRPPINVRIILKTIKMIALITGSAAFTSTEPVTV